jgi:hypothetical protein
VDGAVDIDGLGSSSYEKKSYVSREANETKQRDHGGICFITSTIENKLLIKQLNKASDDILTWVGDLAS